MTYKWNTQGREEYLCSWGILISFKMKCKLYPTFKNRAAWSVFPIKDFVITSCSAKKFMYNLVVPPSSIHCPLHLDIINTVLIISYGIPSNLKTMIYLHRTLQVCSAVPDLGQGKLVLGPGRVWTEFTFASVQSCMGRVPRMAGRRCTFEAYIPKPPADIG